MFYFNNIIAFKEAFSLFDHDGSGSISVDELGTAIRALGQNPTENELRQLTAVYNRDGKLFKLETVN